MRKALFDLLLKHPLELYDAKKALTKNEIEKLYNNSHKILYDKKKYSFKKYKKFCKTFKKYLSFKEQNLLLGKIKRKKKIKFGKKVLNEFNLDQEIKDKLNSFLMANKLGG
jgi:hypothetical protein